MIKQKIMDQFISALEGLNKIFLGNLPLVYVNETKYSANDILKAIKEDKMNEMKEIVEMGVKRLEEILK